MKIQSNQEDLCQEVLVKPKAGVSVFLTRLATGPESKPEVQAVLPFEELIDLESAQKSFEFYPTAIGGVLRYDTIPAEFFTEIINIKDRTERFVRAQTKEKNITNEE